MPFSTCLVGLCGAGLAGGDPRGPRLAFRLGRFSEAQSLPSRARPDAGLLDAARDGNALQLISCNYPRRPGAGFCLRLELLPLPTPPRCLSPDQPRSPRPPPEMSRWGKQIERRPLLVQLGSSGCQEDRAEGGWQARGAGDGDGAGAPSGEKRPRGSGRGARRSLPPARSPRVSAGRCRAPPSSHFLLAGLCCEDTRVFRSAAGVERSEALYCSR